MPIRFRCKYCNQLMGIAHRKAGTEVECPTCKGKVAVPLSSTEMPAAPPSPPAVNAPLFEQSDFGDFLNVPQKDEPVLAAAPQSHGPKATASSRPQPTAGPRPLRLPSTYDVEPIPGPLNDPLLDPNAVGIILSPGRATLLTVVVILGFALAFSAGLIVGRLL